MKYEGAASKSEQGQTFPWWPKILWRYVGPQAKMYALDWVMVDQEELLKTEEGRTLAEHLFTYDAPRVEAHAYTHLGQEDLLKLINQLPDGYRMVFNLNAIEGYSHEEIAEMLNIQPGTSRSQLVKARKMLQYQILQLQKVAV